MSLAKYAAVLGLVASTWALPQPLSIISKRQSLNDFSDSESDHHLNTAQSNTRNPP